MFIDLTLEDCYSFGESAGDKLLETGDDSSVEVKLKNPFPFYDQLEPSLSVRPC